MVDEQGALEGAEWPNNGAIYHESPGKEAGGADFGRAAGYMSLYNGHMWTLELNILQGAEQRFQVGACSDMLARNEGLRHQWG